MKTKIPKSVNVLGHSYKVIWLNQDKLGDHRGECRYPDRVIVLSNELKGEKEHAWIYFLHEIRHAYQFENGFMQILNHQACEMDADQFSSFVISLQKQGIL